MKPVFSRRLLVMRGVVAHALLFPLMLAVPALAGPPSSAPT